MQRHLALAAVCACTLAGSVHELFGQAEVAAWGSVQGIRVEGQLMAFDAGPCLLAPEGTEITRAAKERQRPQYSRTGNRRMVETRLGPVSVSEVVEDTGLGTARVDVRFTADRTAAAGGFFCLDLPRADYGDGTVQLIGATSTSGAVSLGTLPPGRTNEYLRATARGVRFLSPRRQLEVTFAAPTEVVVRGDPQQGSGDIRASMAVLPPKAKRGRTAQNTFTLRAAGEIDRSPAEAVLDISRPGRAFDGLGGNFRIQNPTLDPAVIQYNLDNLRVAWGRVEMPWRSWHPEESLDPAAMEPGQLDPRARRAMEMARTLAQRDIPVIVSVWFPPQWAALGEVRSEHPGGVRGNQLNPAKMGRIYESIASYLLYLKEHYGVEATMFSFNESDLGIDVRQTPEEHLAFIKGFGAHLASRGLSTRMLLGDNSDATTTDFIRPALADTTAWPYIGAVSFHSWRGWSEELLSFWGDAAKQLNVPLLIGEGSTDAGAWRYPAIFQEPAFALEEINLYTRMLAISEPKSILQWQLTADYSLLAGGGVFGDSTALRPTQRFWNLKQLASTPEGAFALPITCGHADLTCAAFGDIAKGMYAVHIVNNGSARPVTLTGLPADLKELRIYVTDSERDMKEGARIAVSGGRARFAVDATSFTTLMGVG